MNLPKSKIYERTVLHKSVLTLDNKDKFVGRGQSTPHFCPPSSLTRTQERTLLQLQFYYFKRYKSEPLEGEMLRVRCGRVINAKLQLSSGAFQSSESLTIKDKIIKDKIIFNYKAKSYCLQGILLNFSIQQSFGGFIT
jgi:hypothetical protein